MPKGLCNHPSGQICFIPHQFWPSFMPLTFYAPLNEIFPTLMKGSSRSPSIRSLLAVHLTNTKPNKVVINK